MNALKKAGTISFRGNRAVVKAINELADRSGKKTADLVYDTMMERWGNEINELVPFFERNGVNKNQSVEKEAV